FTDHPPDLGRLVSEGRRNEFSSFPSFSDEAGRERIPDPQEEETFLRSKLNWSERTELAHAGVLALYKALLELRLHHPTLRVADRDSFVVDALSEGSIAIRRYGETVDLLGVVNLRGEIKLNLTSSASTAPRPDSPWRPVLLTEETRFGGSGARGTLDPDGPLHLIGPGAVRLASDA